MLAKQTNQNTFAFVVLNYFSVSLRKYLYTRIVSIIWLTFWLVMLIILNDNKCSFIKVWFYIFTQKVLHFLNWQNFQFLILKNTVLIEQERITPKATYTNDLYWHFNLNKYEHEHKLIENICKWHNSDATLEHHYFEFRSLYILLKHLSSDQEPIASVFDK